MAEKKDLRLRDKPSVAKGPSLAKSKNEIDMYIEQIKEKLGKIKVKLFTMSAKGGVGKTFLTAALAQYLVKNGVKVALYDADETGSILPFVLGERKAEIYMDTETGEIIPFLSDKGYQILSVEPMLSDKSAPLIWQGALRTKFLLQTLAMAKWDDVDVLLFDLPPGTGDEVITLSQYIPPEKYSIIVTIPGKLSENVVKKSIVFAQKTDIRILGIVENMSYYVCPDGSRIEPLGKSNAETLSEQYGIKLLGKIPLHESIRESHDTGLPIYEIAPGSDIDRELNALAVTIIELLNLRKQK